MASLDFSDIGISHLYGCVPRNTIINREYTSNFSEEIAAAITDKTGIEERRFAEEGVCSSDLCFKAAEALIVENEIDKSEIQFLIFVSQTPDYRMPASSVLLQDRLGLNKSCMAFDISLGCSGFVYGLSVMFGLLQSASGGKGLLLVGETRSRVYSPKDRKTAFLFGDGGIACLIEKGAQFGKSFFDLYSDGSNGHLIKMNAGGYRKPSSPETLKMEICDKDGNIRSEEQGYMDGGEVFNFVLENVPKSIKNLCERAEVPLNSMECYILHQANHFMNQHLSKKLKLDTQRVLSNVHRFGNTSSVSIPLVIATEYTHAQVHNNEYSLISGFGVGMSWANALIRLQNTKIGELIEC